MTKKVSDLLKRRLVEAKTNPGALSDIAYALGVLRETDLAFQGRIETIQDLQKKTEEAASTHDPENLIKLTDALNAFLDEELNEVLDEKLRAEDEREEEKRMIDGTDEGRDQRQEAAEADGFMKYDATETDDDADARRAAAEADDFMKYGAEPAEEAEGDEDVPTGDGVSESDDEDEVTEEADEDPLRTEEADDASTVTCEACGHEQAIETGEVPPQFAEANRKLRKQLETTQSSLSATRKRLSSLKESRGKKALVESERAELQELRTYKRQAELKSRARKAIREAKAVGFVKPEELVTFRESQWPVLIRQWMGPGRAYGTGLRDMPAPAGRTGRSTGSRSATDVFKESFGR